MKYPIPPSSQTATAEISVHGNVLAENSSVCETESRSYPRDGSLVHSSQDRRRGKANGERTNFISPRRIHPAHGPNHPDVHRALELNGRAHLRGFTGKPKQRETGQVGPPGRALELRGQSGPNGQSSKVSIPRRRLLVVSDVERSCLHAADAGWRQSSAAGFPHGTAGSRSWRPAYRCR